MLPAPSDITDWAGELGRGEGERTSVVGLLEPVPPESCDDENPFDREALE